MIRSSLILTATLAFVFVAGAQESPDITYRTPPKALADLVDAPLTPNVSVGPNQEWMVVMERVSLPSIAELSQPELRIAGMRVNPRTNGMSRPSNAYSSLTLVGIANGAEKNIAGIPEDTRIQNVSWSPDGKHLAFTVTREHGIELWATAVETGGAKRLGDIKLNGAYRGSPYHWLSDSRTIVAKIVPSNRGSAPKEPAVPGGPVVKENIGKTSPARTYQDLLKNPNDEDLFEHYLSARVARITLDGVVTPIGTPGLVRQAIPSPNGKFILVESMHRPFSYLVPYSRFPNRAEIWDLDGRVVRELADVPLAEEVPISFDSTTPGPRSFGWRADAPASIHWTEARDGGDPGSQTDIRDQVYLLSEPFQGDAVPLIGLGLRLFDIQWGNDRLALVSERWRKNRKTRTWIVAPGSPDTEPVLLFDRSYEDRYSDPGSPILRSSASGMPVLHTADGGSSLFLSGQGASPEGNHPFLDKLNLKTKEAVRLWQSEAPHYESSSRAAR